MSHITYIIDMSYDVPRPKGEADDLLTLLKSATGHAEFREKVANLFYAEIDGSGSSPLDDETVQVTDTFIFKTEEAFKSACEKIKSWSSTWSEAVDMLYFDASQILWDDDCNILKQKTVTYEHGASDKDDTFPWKLEHALTFRERFFRWMKELTACRF